MQFNEFTRRLESCHLDEETKYLLSHFYEVQSTFSKEMDKLMNICLNLANTLEGVTNLHGQTLEQVRALMEGRSNGVDVHSVRNDPEDN